MKVITKIVDISDDRKALEAEANYEVIGINNIQKTSKLAREGKAFEAQKQAAAWNKRMKNNLNNAAQIEQF